MMINSVGRFEIDYENSKDYGNEDDDTDSIFRWI